MFKKWAVSALFTVAIAVFIAVAMTLLSAVPPLSYLHDWLKSIDRTDIWFGLISGVIAGCLTWRRYAKSKKK